MKFLGVTVFLFAVFLSQCEKKESRASASGGGNVTKPASVNSETEKVSPENNTKVMDEVFHYAGKKGDIEFQMVGKLQRKGKYDGIDYPNDNLIIEYTVKNTGAKDFILYNQGHSDNRTRDMVYVEPQSDGVVELSQKALTEPKDKNCPLRDAPVTPRGGWLKGGQTITEKVLVELPLKQQGPFADCTPRVEMPQNANKIKFCLGIQDTGGKAIKIDDSGNISPLPEVGKQELLCSEVFEMK